MITIFEKAVDGSPDVAKQNYKGEDFNLDNYVYTGSHNLADRKIVATWQSPTAETFNVGEKVLFRGHYFYIQTLPVAQRIYNSVMVLYTITFYAVEYELGLVAFQDAVLDDESEYQYSGNLEVFVYGNIFQLMDRIIANTRRALTIPVGYAWEYVVYTDDNPDYDPLNSAYRVDPTIFKDISVVDGYCLDALMLVTSLYGLTWTIRENRKIYVNYPPIDVPDSEGDPFVFQFGYDKGICEINRIQNDTKIITRAIGYGSNRNIPENYRKGDSDLINEYHPRLMLPETECPDGFVSASVEDLAKYGVREGIYPTNENIYPSIKGMYNTYVPPRRIDIVTEASQLIINDTGAEEIRHEGEWVPGKIPDARYIGEEYGGGIVFWIDPASNGHKGLIASKIDAPTTYKWEDMSGSAPFTTGANGMDIYDGQTNTDILLLNPKTNTLGVAYCNGITEGGFTDWFFPSFAELGEMYLKRDKIGNMGTKTYWSSTEVTGADDWKEAFCFSFGAGSGFARLKGSNFYYIRPVRLFDDSTDVPPVWKEPYTETRRYATPTTVSFKVNDPEFGALGVFERGIYTGVPPKISFLTGYMQGVEFPIKTFVKDLEADGTWTNGMYIVTIERDLSDPNHPLPSTDLNIAELDEFVYLDIYMPDSYVHAAEHRLLLDVQDWLDRNINAPNGYTIKLTEEWIRINPLTEPFICESNAITIEDLILEAPQQSILIQALSITYKEAELLPTYDLTVSTTPITSRISLLEESQKEADKINEIRQNIINRKIRNSQKDTYTLQQTILMTNGDINGGKVGTSTLKSASLTQEARSTNFILQAYMQVNYLGDVNSAHGSSGVLIHKDGDLIWGDVYDVAHNTWTIDNEASFTLSPDVLYWVYIKGSMVDGSAEWIVSADKLGFYEYDNYYMFEWGQIHPVVDEYRYIQTTNGLNGISSYMYVAFASDDTGADFTLIANPLLDFIAFLTTPSQLIPPTASDFAGLWYDRSGGGEAHSPVTIDAGSTDFASIDENQVLTIVEQTGTTYTFDDTTDVDLVNTSNVITANTIGWTGTFKDADGIIFDVLNGLIKSPSGQITVNKVVTQDAVVIDDNTEFSITVTGQRVVSPYVETLSLSQDSPAVFEGVPYDDYVITEEALEGYTLTSIIDDTITLSVGDNEKVVEVINDKDATFTEINYGLIYSGYVVEGTGNDSITSSDSWVIPSAGDFETLLNHIDVYDESLGWTLAGGMLKETGLTYWDMTDEFATNEYGFNASGTGGRGDDDGSFYDFKMITDFLTSSVVGSTTTRVSIAYDISSIGGLSEGFSLGFGATIRLVKTSTSLTEGQTGAYTGNDGKVYHTICIGTQEWLSENLAETKTRDLTDIPEVTVDADWIALTTGALCAYNNDWGNV